MHSNTRNRGRSRRGPKPKWVNPCGIDPSFVRNHAIFSFHDVTPLSDQELIQNILLSAKNALVHSDDFKEKFVSRITFTGIAFHQITGSMRDCCWLPGSSLATDPRTTQHHNQCIAPSHNNDVRPRQFSVQLCWCWELWKLFNSTLKPTILHFMNVVRAPPPTFTTYNNNFMPHLRGHLGRAKWILEFTGCDFTRLRHPFVILAVAGIKMLSGCQEFMSYFLKMYLQLWVFRWREGDLPKY